MTDKQKMLLEKGRDLAGMLGLLVDYASIGIEALSMGNCNDCSLKLTCKYAPTPGEVVRFNCPLWKEKEK